MAEPGVVREHSVQKEAEETGPPEALAGMIFGTRAVAVPAADPALVVELDLATDGARDLVREAGLDPGPAQVVELDLGLDRVAVLGQGAERERAVERGRDSDRTVERVPALDRVAALVLEMEREPAVEPRRDSERVVDSGQG